MISITIPVHDGAHLLPLCLASLQAQTADDWEAVIVDDGSVEPIREVVESFRDDRFRYVRLPMNLGRGAARQTALDYSQGDLIALQDADDWSYPQRLEEQRHWMETHPEADFVGTAAAVSDAQDRCRGVRGDKLISPRLLSPFVHPPVLHPTLMFRRSVLQFHRYDPTIRCAEDHVFLSRALAAHQYGNIPRILYSYREYASQTVAKRVASYAVECSLIRDHFRTSPTRGLWALLWSSVRMAGFVSCSLAGAGPFAVARRSRRPRNSELQEYAEALCCVRRRWPLPGESGLLKS